MWKFVDSAKQIMWAFVELAFLALLALILISLLLGEAAGPYVSSVAGNVGKFASTASSGLIGIVIVLALIYLAARRQGLAKEPFAARRNDKARSRGPMSFILMSLLSGDYAVCRDAMPLSFKVCCNSPAWNISRTMSQPPTNSPLM
jgi:ABC-type dipeptide/oligopeptide/nickel transport system permease component